MSKSDDIVNNYHTTEMIIDFANKFSNQKFQRTISFSMVKKKLPKIK